ncbi:hypothetical protein BHM03_00022062, partial [Ensete ventricosum]
RRDVFSLRSPRGEKKSPHEASTRSLCVTRCFLLPANAEDSPREAGKTRTARYIPVWQLTGTWIGRYRAVALRSAVDGRFPSSMVDFRRLRRRRPCCPSAVAARGFFPPRAGRPSPHAGENSRRRLTMAGSMKLQPDDGPRYSLGIGPSSDDAVRSHRKFARRFAEGIEKLARNAKGDRREEDRRACRKIAGVCGTQSVDQRADQRKSQAEIRKVEGTTFAEIPTGNERRLDCPYHRIRATGNNFRRVNRPGGG